MKISEEKKKQQQQLYGIEKCLKTVAIELENNIKCSEIT